MEQNKSLVVFENKNVSRHYDVSKELWCFSFIDVVEVLIESLKPRKYWNALKYKLSEEGSELSQIMGQLKITGNAILI